MLASPVSVSNKSGNNMWNISRFESRGGDEYQAAAADSEEPRLRGHGPGQEGGDQGRSRDQTQLCRLGGEEIQVRRNTSNYPDICK